MAQAKKKKKFFNVEIPLIGVETHLQAFELEELEGRNLKYDLTRILRGKSVMLMSKVKIENEKATTESVGLKLMPYFLRRMVRKGTNYVEDSFITECADAKLEVKPFLITRRKVSRSVRKALREKTREDLINYLKDKESEEIFDEILKGQLQKHFSLVMKKIYPLSLWEIRVLKILEKKETQKKASKKKEEKTEEKETNSEKE